MLRQKASKQGPDLRVHGTLLCWLPEDGRVPTMFFLRSRPTHSAAFLSAALWFCLRVVSALGISLTHVGYCWGVKSPGSKAVLTSG